MQHTWKITEENVDDRLDLFLVEEFEQTKSRSAIQKAIKLGHILVNGKPATVHRFLKNGDEITYEPKEVVKTNEAPRRNAPKGGAKPSFTVVDENDDWVVIVKPAGVLVHPDGVQDSDTLVDVLVAKYPKMAKVGEDPSRPGIVHRLDREVGGLMVVAKTQSGYEALRKQFSSHEVKKTYLALVHGEMSKEEDDVKFRIARSTTKARMAARPQEEEEGKAAWTHYRVTKRFVGATEVLLEIFSGRTHQIRAHMHALGHPVIGDSLYTAKRPDRNLKLSKLMLQSVELAFIDPVTGDEKAYAVEPDPLFAKLEEEFRVS